MKNLLHDKIILFGGIGIFLILLFLIIVGILPGRKQSGPGSAVLEFWTVGDEEQAWQTVLFAFRKDNPSIEVNHHSFEEAGYEEMLVNRLAEGRGPDIFVLKNSWIERHKDKIYPLPQQTFQFTSIDFQKKFVEAASFDLIAAKSQILGLPLYIDSLALFYNKDAFNSAGIASPPATWNDLLLISRQFTQKTQAGDVIKSGIALGTASNIENFFEILSALFIQNGDRIVDLVPQEQVALDAQATQALKFYTSFADPSGQNFSWTGRLPKDLEALATEKTVMAIGFAGDIQKIQAKNPHLNLGIAPLPQPKDARFPITYGRYYFPTVSRLSRAPEQAWRFLMFVATGNSIQNYLDRNNLAPARRDLLTLGAPDIRSDVFYRQALTAKTWPVADELASKNIFRESIDLLVSKAITAEQATQRIRDRLGLLIQ